MLNRFGSFTIKEFMGLVEANEVRTASRCQGKGPSGVRLTFFIIFMCVCVCLQRLLAELEERMETVTGLEATLEQVSHLSDTPEWECQSLITDKPECQA